MALTFLARRPDSGLGNIRSSPGDPSRNVDWILLGTQGLLTIIGCCIVYSASWTKVDLDPYAFVTRQVVFAITAAVVMAAVMSLDYQFFKEHASFLYALTIALLLLLLVIRFVSPSRSESKGVPVQPDWWKKYSVPSGPAMKPKPRSVVRLMVPVTVLIC